MGALYLYAITDQPEKPLVGRAGFANAQLQSVAYRGIAAIVSPLATNTLAPTAENVLAHEHVIEALMTERTALPARFGTLLPSRQALLDALAQQYHPYLANLDRVRGRVEIGLRILWTPPEPRMSALPREPHADGRSYLMARLVEERQAQAERQAAEILATTLSQHMAALAVDYTAEVLSTPRMLLKAAYLVDQTRIGAFQHAVDQLQASDASLRFLCTGPWPTYHFVTATPEQE